MEHKYLKTFVGRIHGFVIFLTIPMIIISVYLDYTNGREANLWGLGVTVFGFCLFFKAKLSVIKTKKLFSFGCDFMDQKNTNLYFLGWVIMIAGYFLSWT